MAKALDLTGKKFGRLTTIKIVGKDKHHQILWLCKCDCGNEVIVRRGSLTSGHAKSCGCFKIEKSIKRAKEYNQKHEWVENTSLCTLSQNISKNNVSGVKGVYWNNYKEKWEAVIYFKRQHIHLGYFDDIGEAAKVRKEAEEKYFKPMLEKYKGKRANI